MLSVLRKNANNWFMILLFAIITIVFIFTFGSWGGSDVSGELPWAARINGRIISQAQFQATYQSTFNNMRSFQPGFDLKQAKQMNLKETVLDRLIGVELLAQEASDRGLYISDKEIVDEIKRRYFRSTEFDVEQYKRIVNGTFQTNEARFEGQVGRELMGDRLEGVLRESQQVSPAEVKELFETRNDRVNLTVLRIDPEFWSDKFVAPSDAEATTWADAHSDDIKAYYDERINRFRKPPVADVSHIVIKLATDASDDEKKIAREKIEAALKRVDSGEPFGKVAKDVSEDASAQRDGKLGEMTKGETLGGKFEETIFSIAIDKVSDVIESSQGLHVVKVTGRKEESIKEVDEVKVQIAKVVMRTAFVKEKGQAAANKALADAKGGTALADLKLDGFDASLTERNDNRKAPRVEETRPFDRKSRYIPRVGISDELAKAAFMLTEENSIGEKVFEISKRFFVVKLKDRERPDLEKFETARPALENELLNSRRQRVVDTFVRELKNTADIVKNPKVISYGNS